MPANITCVPQKEVKMISTLQYVPHCNTGLKVDRVLVVYSFELKCTKLPVG